MGSKDDLQAALRSLRNVRRMARRLQRVPVDCLRVNGSDIADAEYVTEWLGIVLCRICGQQDVSMPPFEAGAAPRGTIPLVYPESGPAGRCDPTSYLLGPGIQGSVCRESMGRPRQRRNLSWFLPVRECLPGKEEDAMRFPRKEIVEAVRARYPKGTRVELVFMDDPYSRLKPGDRGTVEFVDDIATVHVKWDCGSGLGVAYGADKIRILEGGDFE